MSEQDQRSEGVKSPRSMKSPADIRSSSNGGASAAKFVASGHAHNGSMMMTGMSIN